MLARAPLAALLLVVAGCGSGSAARVATHAPTCPTRAAWQRLADRVHATVLCPTWMPEPLSASLGPDNQYANGTDIKGRTYLVSFLWHESDGSGEAHVNLRAYPGQTAIPRCLRPVGQKRVLSPCFSDSHGSTRIGRYTATLYTANLDADQWHVLYAWRTHGTLYTASMHVAPPYPYTRALAALRHVVTGLIPIAPR